MDSDLKFGLILIGSFFLFILILSSGMWFQSYQKHQLMMECIKQSVTTDFCKSLKP